MGKATDEEAKESLGFQDVALTLSSSRIRRSVGDTHVRFRPVRVLSGIWHRFLANEQLLQRIIEIDLWNYAK